MSEYLNQRNQMFNPVLKNGVTVLDTVRMATYHGDLRFENEQLTLTGVRSITDEAGNNMPCHGYIDEEQSISFKKLFDSEDIQIVAMIGDPVYREPGKDCWCDFRDMTVLFISKKFLDNIKNFNQEWWSYYEPRLSTDAII